MKKIIGKYEWYMEDLWATTKRPNLQITGIEKGEQIQTKCTDRLFGNIKLKTSLVLIKRRRYSYRRFSEHQQAGSEKKHLQTL
jgi:hypothetical protein